MGDFSADEILDVLSADGQVIGTASRLEVHQRGLWHRTFHCLVVRSGSPTRVVLQRRSSLSSFAGKLDLTAAGHLLAGEEPTDGVRELAEETGLTAKAEDLVPVGIHIVSDQRDSVINREQVHVFFVSSDRPLQQFTPDRREIAGLVEVDAARLLEMVDPASQVETVPATEWAPGGIETVSLTPADLISGYDRYLLTLMIMAQRFAIGRLPIAI